MTLPTLRVEAALAAGPSGGPWFTFDDPVRGVFGTGKLADGATTGAYFTDLVAAEGVYTLNMKRGRDKLLQAAQAGTLTATMTNPTRRLDPTNLAGPYVSAGRTLLRPMRPVRVSADWGFNAVKLGGTTADYLSTPHTAAMAVPSLYFELATTGPWQTSGTFTLAGKWGGAGQRSWRLQLINKKLSLSWTTDGTTIQTVTATGTMGSSFVDQQLVYLQVSLYPASTPDVTPPGVTVAGDGVVLFAASTDPFATSLLYTDGGIISGGTSAPFNASSTPITIGQANGSNPAPLTVTRFALYDRTIPVWQTGTHTETAYWFDQSGSARGRLVACFDASWLPFTGTAVVSYPTSETWTLNGSATPQGATTGYKLWYGFADEWAPIRLYPGDGTCTLTATEGFKILTRIDNSASGPVGAGEKTGARVGRLLTTAGIATEDRDLDVGQTAVQATTLAQNVLTELQLTADTERGDLWYGPDGRWQFRDRTSRYTRVRSKQAMWIFGDAGDGLEIPYSAPPKEGIDDDLVLNDVSVARVGGTAQVAQDAASIAENLTRTFTRTDLIHQTDTESANYAGITLAEFKDSAHRFDQIIIQSSADDRIWPVILGMQIGDRCSVRMRPPGGGSLFSQDCFIENLEHTVVPPLWWMATVTLSDASRWGGFVFDDPVLGVLDTSRLAY